ncbi:MAG: fumarate hydratase [Ruminococcus sp.]|jgi:fumarate hydratase subunit alpha|nr:fumarate hydratase [Ruminococcus sp.]
MRTIDSKKIENIVAKACIDANLTLPKSIEECLLKESKGEDKEVLQTMCKNLEVAKTENIPICQDTGMAVVFAEIGQDVHISGDDLVSAINKGVSRGYTEGYLRKSVVGDPFYRRINTGDNTPAVVHIDFVKGDELKITVAPKGAGSENMSALKMFTPAATEDDIIDFIVTTVKNAGSNPCPPVVVGVGIGGNFEKSAILSKKALCRDLDKRNEDELYRALEEKVLKRINELGIGAAGFGGDLTAIAVNIEVGATHIAMLPVAVNMGCWVTRHVTATC